MCKILLKDLTIGKLLPRKFSVLLKFSEKDLLCIMYAFVDIDYVKLTWSYCIVFEISCCIVSIF